MKSVVNVRLERARELPSILAVFNVGNCNSNSFYSRALFHPQIQRAIQNLTAKLQNAK